MNEAILGKMVQMLYGERLDRAARARLVRRALAHRAPRDEDPPRPEAARKPCRKTEQAAY